MPCAARSTRQVAGKDEAQVKAIWSKLVFTGKATPPKELPSSADVVKAVAADPGTSGMSTKGTDRRRREGRLRSEVMKAAAFAWDSPGAAQRWHAAALRGRSYAALRVGG